jgi:hypothetical protein
MSKQLELIADAITPATFRTEADDRYDAALLEGVPKSAVELVAGDKNLSPGELFFACMDLLGREFTLKEIAKLAKIRLPYLQLILKIKDLPVPLMQAILDGRLPRRRAERILKLAPAKWDDLADILRTDAETVTDEDIDALKTAQRAEQTTMLPDSLFGGTNEEAVRQAPAIAFANLIEGYMPMFGPEELRREFEAALAQFAITIPVKEKIKV